MIPLRDDNPTKRFPWVTVLLIAINVAIFVLEFTLEPADLAVFLQRWGFIPARFLATPADPLQWLTGISAMFLHAGWIHLLGNMLYLWIFGNNVEDRFGPLGYLGFYLACGVAATTAQAAVGPTSAVPLVGASGAVAGVLGAYAVLYPRAGVVTVIPLFFFFEVARVPALFVIGFWFVLQLASGLASLDPAMSASAGVAWFAHIGGFLTGIVLTIPAWIRTRRRAWR